MHLSFSECFCSLFLILVGFSEVFFFEVALSRVIFSWQLIIFSSEIQHYLLFQADSKWISWLCSTDTVYYHNTNLYIYDCLLNTVRFTRNIQTEQSHAYFKCCEIHPVTTDSLMRCLGHVLLKTFSDLNLTSKAFDSSHTEVLSPLNNLIWYITSGFKEES